MKRKLWGEGGGAGKKRKIGKIKTVQNILNKEKQQMKDRCRAKNDRR